MFPYPSFFHQFSCWGIPGCQYICPYLSYVGIFSWGFWGGFPVYLMVLLLVKSRNFVPEMQKRWSVNGFINAFQEFLDTFSQVQIVFAFHIYCNVCVQYPYFILESMFSRAFLSVYLIISTYVFGCSSVFNIEGSLSVKWSYVIILMSFYVSP